jgi:hypothetical protein
MRYVSALLLATFSSFALPAAYAAGPTPQHSAECVAALEADAEAMAAQYRSGRTEVEPELVRRVQQGFAFIGTAYLQGVRDAEADRLLKAAQAAQKEMPSADLVTRQAACRTEGTRLLEKANAIEREFVTEAARRRVDRMKRPRTPG